MRRTTWIMYGRQQALRYRQASLGECVINVLLNEKNTIVGTDRVALVLAARELGADL